MAAGYVVYGHYSDSGECFYVGKKYGLGCYLEQERAVGAYKNALENYQNKGELPCR